MKSVNRLRMVLNTIIFIPLIIMGVSAFGIDKNLMAKLMGLIVLLLFVPLINILLEIRLLYKSKSGFKQSSVAIIIANVILFFINFNILGSIGMMF